MLRESTLQLQHLWVTLSSFLEWQLLGAAFRAVAWPRSPSSENHLSHPQELGPSSLIIWHAIELPAGVSWTKGEKEEPVSSEAETISVSFSEIWKGCPRTWVSQLRALRLGSDVQPRFWKSRKSQSTKREMISIHRENPSNSSSPERLVPESPPVLHSRPFCALAPLSALVLQVIISYPSNKFPILAYASWSESVTWNQMIP